MTGCGQDIGTRSRDFFNHLFLKVRQNRIPISGGIELTGRCNLNCVHCYLNESKRRGIDSQSELSTGQWINLIDQMADAGCLFLLFTGGESFLRPDFPEIYTHASKKGLLINVFSNGTLVTDKILDVFLKYPPYSIEISVYGATAKTYEKITGIKGSFKKCMQGIRRLIDRGFRVKLKTMLLNVSIHEIEAMEAMAEELAVPFRFDALVAPRLDSDPTPVNYRVSPEQAVAKEFSSRKRAKEYHDFYYRMKRQEISKDLYSCSAGMDMFHIDASGKMRPCLMVTAIQKDLKTNRFSEMWQSNDFTLFREQEKAPVACRTCDKKPICGYCPGLFKLESGSERVYSDFICEIGRERKQAVLNMKTEG